MQHKKRILLTIAAIIVLIIGIGGTVAVKKEINDYNAFVKTIHDEETEYQKAYNTLEEKIESIPANELIDTELENTAQNILNEKVKEYQPNKLMKILHIETEYPIEDKEQQEYINWYEKQSESMIKTADSLEKNHKEWELNQAKTALNEIIVSAKESKETIGEEVTNKELINQLSDLISQAETLINEETDISKVQEAQTNLKNKVDEIKKDHDAYVEQKKKEAEEAAKKAAEEKAKKEAAEAAKKAQATQNAQQTQETQTNNTTQNIWYVSYVNSYHTAEAPADGSVGLWESGYYIAHDWSANGRKIKSCVPYVNVDGVTYKYVSSQYVSRDTYWSDVEAFVHANGGIGFQTCAGNTYFISHYEPA